MSEGARMGLAKAIRETDKALLVEIDELEESVWIPKTQIHADSEVYEDGQAGHLVVNEWFAEKQGWT